MWASKKKIWYYREIRRHNPKEKYLEEIKIKYRGETLKRKEKEKIAN